MSDPDKAEIARLSHEVARLREIITELVGALDEFCDGFTASAAAIQPLRMLLIQVRQQAGAASAAIDAPQVVAP
jgi:hypothetical protein